MYFGKHFLCFCENKESQKVFDVVAVAVDGDDDDERASQKADLKSRDQTKGRRGGGEGVSISLRDVKMLKQKLLAVKGRSLYNVMRTFIRFK